MHTRRPRAAMPPRRPQAYEALLLSAILFLEATFRAEARRADVVWF